MRKLPAWLKPMALLPFLLLLASCGTVSGTIGKTRAQRRVSMEMKSEQSTDNPDLEDAVRKPAKKKPVKRKKPAAKKQRPRKAAEPVAEPTELPLTMQEAKESLGKAKDEFARAVAEPAMKALGRYSGMVRDALAGAVGGFLGNKKRGD